MVISDVATPREDGPDNPNWCGNVAESDDMVSDFSWYSPTIPAPRRRDEAPNRNNVGGPFSGASMVSTMI